MKSCVHLIAVFGFALGLSSCGQFFGNFGDQAQTPSRQSASRQSAMVRVQSSRRFLIPERREPVFFNGKIYQVAMQSSIAADFFAVRIVSMIAHQQKEARELATSSVRHFYCADGQTGMVIDKPRFDKGSWWLKIRCQ